MLYLGCGRTELPLRADSDAGLMLLGGEPFEEEIVMCWNFIGRSSEEIVQAREDWMNGLPIRRGEGLRRRPTARSGTARRCR